MMRNEIKIPKGVVPRVEHPRLPKELIDKINESRLARMRTHIETIRDTGVELTWENLPDIIEKVRHLRGKVI